MQKWKIYNFILTLIIIIPTITASYLIFSNNNPQLQLIGTTILLFVIICQTLIFQNIYNRDFLVTEIIKDNISKIPSLIQENNTKLIKYIENNNSNMADYIKTNNSEIIEYMDEKFSQLIEFTEQRYKKQNSRKK